MNAGRTGEAGRSSRSDSQLGHRDDATDGVATPDADETDEISSSREQGPGPCLA